MPTSFIINLQVPVWKETCKCSFQGTLVSAECHRWGQIYSQRFLHGMFSEFERTQMFWNTYGENSNWVSNEISKIDLTEICEGSSAAEDWNADYVFWNQDWKKVINMRIQVDLAQNPIVRNTYPSQAGNTTTGDDPQRTQTWRWECEGRSPHRASRNSCKPSCTGGWSVESCNLSVRKNEDS